MKFDFKCNFDLDDCIRKLGLDERGRVQQDVTSEFMKNVEPYVPFSEGGLKDSRRYEQEEEYKHMAEKVYVEDDTVVVWDTPYARRLYYGEMDWNWSNGGVQEGGLRGPYWAERYFQDGGKEQLERVARNAIKKM